MRMLEETPRVYTPDNWVILKVRESKMSKPFYKVLGGWSGGYASGNAWRMNSGILEFIDKGDHYEAVGFSGSVYICRKSSYGLRMNCAHVYTTLKEREGFENQIVLMDEDTDWSGVEW